MGTSNSKVKRKKSTNVAKQTTSTNATKQTTPTTPTTPTTKQTKLLKSNSNRSNRSNGSNRTSGSNGCLGCLGKNNKVFELDDGTKQVFQETRKNIYTSYVLSPKAIIFPQDVYSPKDGVPEKITLKHNIEVQLQLNHNCLEIQDINDSSNVFKRINLRQIVNWTPYRVKSFILLNILIDENKFLPCPAISIKKLVEQNIEDETNELQNDTNELQNDIFHVRKLKQKSKSMYTLQLIFISKKHMQKFNYDLSQHIYQNMYDYGIITLKTLTDRLYEIDTSRRCLFADTQ